MQRVLALILLCAATFLLNTPSTAAPPKVYSPAKNSAEFAQIMAVIHGGEFAEMYTAKRMNVTHASRQRSIAYVEYEGPVGVGEVILTRQGKGPWKDVWGEGDGGSNSCAVGAAHYAWALKLIKDHGVKPDALFPGLSKETAELQKQAKADPELQCVGDLSGGPTR
jgi:hypothetical protein